MKLALGNPPDISINLLHFRELSMLQQTRKNMNSARWAANTEEGPQPAQRAGTEVP